MPTYQKVWKVDGAIIRQRGCSYQVETHHNGKRTRQTFKTVAEADNYARQVKAEIKSEGACPFRRTGVRRRGCAGRRRQGVRHILAERLSASCSANCRSFASISRRYWLLSCSRVLVRSSRVLAVSSLGSSTTRHSVSCMSISYYIGQSKRIRASHRAR